MIDGRTIKAQETARLFAKVYIESIAAPQAIQDGLEPLMAHFETGFMASFHYYVHGISEKEFMHYLSTLIKSRPEKLS